MNKVFANAGGTYVELDTSGDHHYDATGLIRIHRKGVPPQLGPSDSLLAAAAYSTPADSPVTTGVGVSWQDSSGSWRTLGEMNPSSANVTPLIQSPERVAFDVTYSGGLAGVGSVTEHYFVTPQGVQLTTEIPGYSGPLRYVCEVLLKGWEFAPQRGCVVHHGGVAGRAEREDVAQPTLRARLVHTHLER